MTPIAEQTTMKPEKQSSINQIEIEMGLFACLTDRLGSFTENKKTNPIKAGFLKKINFIYTNAWSSTCCIVFT